MYVFKQTNKKGWQRKTSQLQCPDGTVLTRRHFSSNEKRLPLLLVIWHRCSTVLAQAFCSTRDVLALGFFCLSYTLAVSSQADECARKCARVESWLALEGRHFTIFLPLGNKLAYAESESQLTLPRTQPVLCAGCTRSPAAAQHSG